MCEINNLSDIYISLVAKFKDFMDNDNLIHMGLLAIVASTQSDQRLSYSLIGKYPK